MLRQRDDLFACGVVEPANSPTVCDVFGIDDLIVVGIIAAASIAASTASANANESASDDLTDQKQKFAMRQQAINWYKQQQDRAASSLSQAPGFRGYRSSSEALQPWADKLAIQNGADLEKQAAARQADAARTQGYINGGAVLAKGIAGAALSPSSSSIPGAGSLSNTFDSTGIGLADRAGAYDLPAFDSGVSTPQIHPSDVPSAGIAATQPGGFQLQPQDYGLLNGGGIYSQGPYGDDPYGVNYGQGRYGFNL